MALLAYQKTLLKTIVYGNFSRRRDGADGVRAPEVQDQLAALGTQAAGNSIEEVDTFRAAEARRWGEVIRRINFKIE
jgi:hypothetical protein